MDKRQIALQALKELIRRQKGKLDPKLLKMAENALQGMPLPPDTRIPYDKEAAAETIRLFLENHENPDGFQKNLLEMLRKSQH